MAGENRETRKGVMYGTHVPPLIYVLGVSTSGYGGVGRNAKIDGIDVTE